MLIYSYSYMQGAMTGIYNKRTPINLPYSVLVWLRQLGQVPLTLINPVLYVFGSNIK